MRKRGIVPRLRVGLTPVGEGRTMRHQPGVIRMTVAINVIALALAGCADKPKPTEDEPPAKAKSPIQVIGNNYLPAVGRIDPSNDFHNFYQLYQIYLNDSGRPLTKLEDLKAMNLDREASKIYQAFMEGRSAFNF